MSRNAYKYYNCAERWERIAVKKRKRADKAAKKAKDKLFRGTPSPRADKRAQEKLTQAELADKTAKDLGDRADRYYRTELAMRSTGISRKRSVATAHRMPKSSPMA